MIQTNARRPTYEETRYIEEEDEEEEEEEAEVDEVYIEEQDSNDAEVTGSGGGFMLRPVITIRCYVIEKRNLLAVCF